MDAQTELTAALARDLDGTFERMVLSQQDRLYSIALRMLGDPRDAEEIAQDAFVRAYRALAGYEADRIRDLQLRAWLATIVLNLCRNRVRRHGLCLFVSREHHRLFRLRSLGCHLGPRRDNCPASQIRGSG